MNKVQKRQLLYQHALEVEPLFHSALEELRGEKTFLSLTHEDRLRLLTLKVWMLRYKVPLTWILETLLQHYSKFIRRRRTGSTLGVRVATLVSQSSKQVLEEEILKQFPCGENISRWKTAQQRQQLHQNGICRMQDPMTFASDYGHWLEQARRDHERATDKFSVRPYRDNPWRI